MLVLVEVTTIIGWRQLLLNLLLHEGRRGLRVLPHRLRGQKCGAHLLRRRELKGILLLLMRQKWVVARASILRMLHVRV